MLSRLLPLFAISCNASTSPEQFAKLIRSEYEANAKVAKEANTKAD